MLFLTVYKFKFYVVGLSPISDNIGGSKPEYSACDSDKVVRLFG